MPPSELSPVPLSSTVFHPPRCASKIKDLFEDERHTKSCVPPSCYHRSCSQISIPLSRLKAAGRNGNRQLISFSHCRYVEFGRFYHWRAIGQRSFHRNTTFDEFNHPETRIEITIPCVTKSMTSQSALSQAAMSCFHEVHRHLRLSITSYAYSIRGHTGPTEFACMFRLCNPMCDTTRGLGRPVSAIGALQTQRKRNLPHSRQSVRTTRFSNFSGQTVCNVSKVQVLGVN